MRAATKIAMAGLAATACSPSGSGGGSGPATGAPAPVERADIRYETSPCFGACPVYVVTVRPDGSGVFEGKRFTAVSGTQAFDAGPDGYRRFAETLAIAKPEGERVVQPGTKDCDNAPTDMPSADVRWSTGQHLNFYYGCRMGSEGVVDALRRAPEMLPIEALIGKK
jgi:hypothetical protein